MTQRTAGGTNCRECLGCQPMVCLQKPITYLYRCYGEDGGYPIKRDFARGMQEPPEVAPEWCPNRKLKERT